MSTRPELTYDGHGINGPDEYRTRVVNFQTQADADKYGKLLAAAPDLLEALRELLEGYERLLAQSVLDVNPGANRYSIAARAAIAKAEGIA